MNTNTAVLDHSVASLANAPRQQRSRELTTRILDAALRVLQRPDTNFTIRAVAHEGGVSVGGICGRFADRDELLCAAHSYVIERLETRVRNSLSKTNTSLRKTLQGFITSVAVTWRDDGLAMAKIQTEPVAERALRRAAGGVGALHELLCEAISLHLEEIARPDHKFAAHIIIQMVLGALTREITLPNQIQSDKNWSDLCEELERAAYSYLLSAT